MPEEGKILERGQGYSAKVRLRRVNNKLKTTRAGRTGTMQAGKKEEKPTKNEAETKKTEPPKAQRQTAKPGAEGAKKKPKKKKPNRKKKAKTPT